MYAFGSSTKYPAPCAMYALSCGTTGDVFGIHRDKVEYDDGAHGEGTESVGEGVQSIVGDHSGEGIGKARDSML